jgi:hypothetical protein
VQAKEKVRLNEASRESPFHEHTAAGALMYGRKDIVQAVKRGQLFADCARKAIRGLHRIMVKLSYIVK